MNKILTREQYLDTLRTQRYIKYTGVPKYNEAFANDVNWGDSWVGRMINSIIRKGKISINLRRVDSLGKRLQSIFDELVDSGKVIANNGVKSFITTSCLIGELEKMVKGESGKEGTESDIPNIISHIVFLIGQVQSYDLEDKEELIEVLQEFKKYLEELLKKQGKSEDDETGDEDEVGDKESKEIGDPNQIFFQESKKFLQSVVDLHNMIKNNVVRFSEEEYGKKVNVGLQFDNDKFQNLLKTYNQSKPENKLSILRQLVPMIEKGLDSYKAQNKKDKITEFDNLFKKYAGELSGLEREALDKNKKKETPLDDLKNLPKVEKTPTPTKKSVDEIAKELEKKWIASQISQGKNTKPGQGTRERFEKEAKRIANESILFEEVEQNLEKGENHARNAWKKVVDAYNKSGVTKYIPQIEELLSVGVKDGKEKAIQAKKNIILVCKQVITNKLTVGKPISLDDLIKEGIYDNDLPKAISLFGKILLSFNEDLGLASAYGSRGRDPKTGQALGTNPVKVFVNSFNNLEKTLPKLGGVKKEYKVGDTVKYKLTKGGEGEKEITKVEGDRFFFKSKSGEELSAPLKIITGKVEKKQESIISNYVSFSKIFEKTEGVDYDEVSDKFDELFTDEIIKKFSIEESNVEEIKGLGSEGDTIIITGADPIMEIVRLFQRAWRLHTPGIIPSGRTGGKVSTSVFMEYENLGERDGTPDAPGSGPYRNIELYEKWNEAVMNILSNSKYRTTIFSDDAKFAWNYKEKTEVAKISKDNLSKQGKAEIEGAKPLGKILLRFVNRLLSDSEMYKKDGALPKFLNEYFGLDRESIDKLGGIVFSGFKKDANVNTETAGEIKQTLCKFEKWNKVDEMRSKSAFKDYFKSDESEGLVFRIKANGKYKYFYTLKKIQNSVYFLIFDSFVFDTKNCSVSEKRNPVSDAKVVKFDVNAQQNFIDGKTIKLETWDVYGKLDNEGILDYKLESEPSVLIDNKEKSPFKDCKFDNQNQKKNIKNHINKIKPNLI